MKPNKKSDKWRASLKQTIMLKKALVEEGIDLRNCQIEVNHDLGFSIVNGVTVPIIFPKSHFEFAKKCHTVQKKYMFYFNGNAGKGDARAHLMRDFLIKPASKIIFNDEGRVVENKGQPNPTYFKEMASSQFSLCPHQPKWRGNWDALWTYRYIEALMLKTMPVQFKETPLSKHFIADSIFRWDDDSFETLPTEKELAFNFNLAEKNFSLSTQLIKQIIS